ncbi:MAG: PTS system mannose/fructose/sorbose family transporter subunit IID [Desulfuromonadales bacterium]|nr:PTS system mannose/fructose/sorbose family transporter subunit IID [Desulfuromonadales bacterium]
MESPRLPKALIARVLVRSFFLQASWNFERLQSLGSLYAIVPALRFLYRGEALTLACQRHLEYFNTHPFMASPVLGTLLALEEKSCRGEKTYLGVQEFRRMIMAPYAAVGDALFWGGLRPAAAAVALLFALRESLWAPVVFLLMFNLPHLFFRFFGLVQGYVQGLKIVEVIQGRRLPDLAIRFKEATVVLLGGACAALAFFTTRAEALPAGWGLVAAPLVILLGKLAHRGISTLLLVLAAATVVLALDRIF